MAIPLIGAAIAGTMAVVGGRLVGKGLASHNRQEDIKKKYEKVTTRNSGGITGAGSKNVNPVYRNSNN